MPPLHSDWKTFVIILVQKLGTGCGPINYHQIDDIPIVSKIMERLIQDGIIAGLLKNKLINTEQHDFLRKKSRATCMADCLRLIIKALSTWRSVVVIFLHKARAFYRVSHRRLLNKIESYGIISYALPWFPSCRLGTRWFKLMAS